MKSSDAFKNKQSLPSLLVDEDADKVTNPATAMVSYIEKNNLKIIKIP